MTSQLGGANVLCLYLLTWLLITDIALQDVKIKGTDVSVLMISLNIVSPLIADAIHVQVMIASEHLLCSDSEVVQANKC